MDAIDYAITALSNSRKTLNSLFDGFTAESALAQPTPGVNHVLWQTGHLAHTEDWYAGLLAGSGTTLPERYASLFGYGSTSEGTDAYPSFDEVKAQLATARERVVAAVRAASDEKLAEQCEDLGTDFLGGALMVSWHEGWHSGQISIIRRALGLPSIYG